MLANITNKASLKEPDYITAKPGEVKGQRSVSVQGIPTARKIEAALEERPHKIIVGYQIQILFHTLMYLDTFFTFS